VAKPGERNGFNRENDWLVLNWFRNPDSFGNNQKKLVSEFVKNYRLAKRLTRTALRMQEVTEILLIGLEFPLFVKEVTQRALRRR
jgi:hypothetical protein